MRKTYCDIKLNIGRYANYLGRAQNLFTNAIRLLAINILLHHICLIYVFACVDCYYATIRDQAKMLLVRADSILWQAYVGKARGDKKNTAIVP